VDPDNTSDVVAALRRISRGIDALADALAGGASELSLREREHAVLAEWDERGLTRKEASALLRRHGFAPQTAGGWARGNWIELRDDGLRYTTDKARQSLADRAPHSPDSGLPT
jgi:hypothetical protein